MLTWLKTQSKEVKFFLCGIVLLGQAVTLSLLLPEPLSAYIAFPIAVIGGVFAYRNFT